MDVCELAGDDLKRLSSSANAARELIVEGHGITGDQGDICVASRNQPE